MNTLTIQTHSEQQKKLLEMLSDFRVAMLVSKDDVGDLHARPMSLVKTEDSGDLWFCTSIESTKTKELQINPQVGVTFQKPSEYVSITGNAELTQDKSKIDALWSEDWKIWFPNGKDDPSITLIRVRAEEAEYWNMPASKNIRFLFEAAKAHMGLEPDHSLFTENRHDNVHAKVDLK